MAARGISNGISWLLDFSASFLRGGTLPSLITGGGDTPTSTARAVSHETSAESGGGSSSIVNTSDRVTQIERDAAFARSITEQQIANALPSGSAFSYVDHTLDSRRSLPLTAAVDSSADESALVESSHHAARHVDDNCDEHESCSFSDVYKETARIIEAKVVRLVNNFQATFVLPERSAHMSDIDCDDCLMDDDRKEEDLPSTYDLVNECLGLYRCIVTPLSVEDCDEGACGASGGASSSSILSLENKIRRISDILREIPLASKSQDAIQRLLQSSSLLSHTALVEEETRIKESINKHNYTVLMLHNIPRIKRILFGEERVETREIDRIRLGILKCCVLCEVLADILKTNLRPFLALIKTSNKNVRFTTTEINRVTERQEGIVHTLPLKDIKDTSDPLMRKKGVHLLFFKTNKIIQKMNRIMLMMKEEGEKYSPSAVEEVAKRSAWDIACFGSFNLRMQQQREAMIVMQMSKFLKIIYNAQRLLNGDKNPINMKEFLEY